MSSYIELALIWAVLIGFVGTLIHLHKKQYYPK
jgi:hypothetical protein